MPPATSPLCQKCKTETADVRFQVLVELLPPRDGANGTEALLCVGCANDLLVIHGKWLGEVQAFN